MKVRCVDNKRAQRFLSVGKIYEAHNDASIDDGLLLVMTDAGWQPYYRERFEIVSRDTNEEDKEMCKKDEDYSFHVSSMHQIDIQKIQDTLSLGKPIAILSSEKKPKQVFVVISPQIYWKIWKCGIPGPEAVRHEGFLRGREQKWVPHRDLREIVERVRMIAKTPWREDTMKGRIDVTHVYS